MTSLAVTSLPGPVAIGDSITVTDGIHSAVFVASASALLGATSITVSSAVPTFGFGDGAQVSFPVDPATVSVIYKPGRSQATVTLTYSASQVQRAAKGVYYVDLDTTGLPGYWTGYFATTGVGQAVSDAFSFVVNALPY